MTQIASLGMTTASIRSTEMNSSDLTKEASLQFADLMSKNTKNSFEPETNATDDRDAFSVRTDTSDQTDTKHLDYASKSGKAKPIAQAAKKNDGRVDETLKENVKQLTEDVKKALTDTCEVSEEELTQAMELLGLSEMDLLQPQNLMQLIGELTGDTDVSALLTNESVQQLLTETNALFADFKQTNELTNAQFDSLLAQLSEPMTETNVQVLKELTPSDELSPDMTGTIDTTDDSAGEVIDTAQFQTEEPAETEAADAVTFKSESQESMQADKSQVQTEDELTQSIVQTKTNNEDSGEELFDEPENGTKDAGSENVLEGKSQKPENSNTTDFKNLTETKNEPVLMQTQNTSAHAIDQTAEIPQTEVLTRYESLMDQMEGLARAFASSEGTSLQVQLNPENLGRLVLTVTEKHGNVTAQITATNEQVKETLQTQMSELHATLQAQGIKVEAVEVTVATHEFEQNLDGNSSANAQMQNEGGGSGRREENSRRNLDAAALAGGSEGLNETESLAANIMRDNGGSVDYTA